jgi:luciferase family oxidoreductase group 1
MVPLSVLDLSPITRGSDAGFALNHSLDLARHAEKLGYCRYWLAEHHSMPGIASAATSVAIAHVAGGTRSIRVGSGGVMLPNHAPLVIAEQFGTLESLFPGRIDLGLGRAPGTDPLTARALRRGGDNSADTFPSDVLELQGYFQPARPNQAVRAVPGAGLRVPIWLLGSSLYSAQLAAEMGLPFAFAAHFAPDLLGEALDLYRARFKRSAALERPYAMAAVGIFAAETDAEARRLFTSQQLAFLNLRRGTPAELPPPVDSLDGHSEEFERAMIGRAFREAIVGSPDRVRQGMVDFVERTQVDELMVTAAIYDHAARVHSYELVAAAGSSASVK